VSTCKQKGTCKKCHKHHHTLLHQEAPAAVVSVEEFTPKPATPTTSADLPAQSTHCAAAHTYSPSVLMGTLLVSVLDNEGEMKTCRVFLDPGSKSKFISEQCVNMLGLRRKRTCVSVSGNEGLKGLTSTGIVPIRIHSRVSDFSIMINALLIPTITGLMPDTLCKTSWPHLEGLQLSDPNFYKPGHVDILVSAEIAGYLMLMNLLRGLRMLRLPKILNLDGSYRV